jgi:signal transduction histidine kinase
MLTIGFSAVGLLLAYLPAADSFRTQWMRDRIEAAAIAALAADVAPRGTIGDAETRALLSGAGAIHVARARGNQNELILYGGSEQRETVFSDLIEADRATLMLQTIDALFGPEGRYLRVRAHPMSGGEDGEVNTDEVIDVILMEDRLKDDLAVFTRHFFTTSIFVTLGLGALIYGVLFYLFVRPMRRLSGAMTRFQKAPDDASRVINPSGASNEIGRAEAALADMQGEVRAALKQRERLAALGEAVAKINHDLRNILTSAQLISDSLASSNDLRVRKQGERLVRAVDRGVRLCEETLAYGRAEETAPERMPLSARALIDEAASDAMLSEGEAEWENRMELELMVDADPDHAHRIFLNLFRNALQAMHAAGAERKQLCVSAQIGEDGVEIDVVDTGPGVPEKARERLFRAFSGSTRKGGLGLGLSIARELARAHGGDVALVETGVKGAVFRVRLPRVGD